MIACDGHAVTPGLVDAHIHLDKALLDDRAPSREGSLAEALRVTGEAKRGFTREDISSRARRVLDMAIRQLHVPQCNAHDMLRCAACCTSV